MFLLKKSSGQKKVNFKKTINESNLKLKLGIEMIKGRIDELLVFEEEMKKESYVAVDRQLRIVSKLAKTISNLILPE